MHIEVGRFTRGAQSILVDCGEIVTPMDADVVKVQEEGYLLIGHQ